MPELAMPRLSDSMEEGTIIKWLVEDGAEVSRGDEIVEIETDKATMTYEADVDGVLSIVAQEGDTLPIGEPIAKIGEEAASGGGGDGRATQAEQSGGDDEGARTEGDAEAGEETDPEPEGEGEAREGEAAEQEGERRGAPAATEEPGSGGGEGNGRVKASPVARRMAREQGVELAALTGSGPGGRIVKADVEAAARDGAASGDGGEPEEEAAAAERGEAEPAREAGGRGEATQEELSRTQQVIARRMAESKATVPDFLLNTEVDMEEAVALRMRLKEAAGEDDVIPSFNDFVVKAAALALRAFPRANGSYKDGRFELHSRVNVGVAVAAQDALIVPTVFDADRKSLGEIARASRELAGKAREGKVSPPELSGGTFTVSNLGMFGITHFSAIINPPQAAILAVGAIERKPVFHDDEIVARHRMRMTLTSDHRILYGADAAQFLGRIRELLERPLKMAL